MDGCCGGDANDFLIDCSWLLSRFTSIYVTCHILLYKTTEVKIQLSMKHERERERGTVYVCAGVCVLVPGVIFQSGHIFLQCHLYQIDIHLD
jgi:hypothetical protein